MLLEYVKIETKFTTTFLEQNNQSINFKHLKQKIIKMETNTEKFYIFRTYSAGVFFGNKKSLKGTEAIVTNCRRLWAWSGAASLSQLAIEGTTNPQGCKFTMTVTDPEGVYLPQTVEIIPCTPEAVKSINSVKEWKL